MKENKYRLKAIFLAKQAVAVDNTLSRLQSHCADRATTEYSEFFNKNIPKFPHCKFRHLLYARYIRFKKLSIEYYYYYDEYFPDEDNVSINDIAALNI